MDAGLFARSNGLIKHVSIGLTILLAIQLGAILFPYVCLLAFRYVARGLYACIYDLYTRLYTYFSPDFETALKNGYTRPIIGLRLCWRCLRLRYTPQDCRMQHFDNAAQLKVSGSKGCWLCHAVNEQFRQSQAEFENPPKHHRPDDLRTHHLLLWFAERTETSSGFLDQLRGKSYISYIYGRHTRDVALDPSSEASFDLVKEWVRRCDEQHSCYQGDHSPLPSRVIDVSAETPYLYISDHHHAPYMTLSHCWGGKQPLTTTTATLEEKCMGVSMASFPELYRDAVIITRKLGIRYLWIDSLCILQDCKDDWSREAAKMGDIYRLSYLTLYALSSPDCGHGMLVQRNGLASEEMPSLNNASSLEKTRAHVFRTAPLCQRAWALQERLLSPRLLYYSDGETFWECLAHTAREGNHRVIPHKPTSYRYESYECPQVRIQLVRPLEDNPSFPVSIPSDWQIIVSEYSRCRLTYRSDKLPALSGLASMYRRNTGYTYVAGMWMENLADELLWFCPLVQDYQPQNLEASSSLIPEPSWSWISTDLAVRFKALGNITGTWSTEFELIHLTGTDQAVDDDIPHVLTIRAYFYRISLQITRASRSCILLDGTGCEKLGRGILDVPDGLSIVPRSCAAIVVRRKLQLSHRGRFQSLPDMTYLLLVVPAPDARGEERWRRIGLAWTTRSLTSAPEKSLIRLV